MAWVTQDFIDTWQSGQEIGGATPNAVVQVQQGHWARNYDPWVGPAMRANIPGEPRPPIANPYYPGTPGGGFFQPTWFPTSGWVTVPNVLTIKRTRDFTQNGVTVLEVTIDAVDFVNAVGALGDAYHIIAPGFIAPYRNFVPSSRPDPGWSVTDMEGMLVDTVKIRVWQGLGAPVADPDLSNPPTSGGDNGAWTFVGHIDDVDTDAGDSSGGNPNQIVITARNGKLLTDEQLFGWTKSQQLKDPISFYDDLTADMKTFAGFRAHAQNSAWEDPYVPSNVLDLANNPWSLSDPAYQTVWRGPAGAADDIQWIQIRLGQGRYEDCWIVTKHQMSCYIGVYAKDLVYRTAGTNYLNTDSFTGEILEPPTMDAVEMPPDAWLPGPIVPGQDWNYFAYVPTLPAGINRVPFNHTLEIGNRSILRVGFTNLPTIDGAPRAEVADLHGRKRRPTSDAAQAQWITVPDVSDVVRVCLRWAGYKNWVVEETGVRLNGRLIFNRSQTMMDIINTIAQQTGFIFFIADPVDGNSEGIPTFRRDSSSLIDNNYIAADLRDDGNLVGIKRKSTDETRPRIIRVRGTSTPASRDIPGRGVRLEYGGGFVGLGGDTVKRIMAVYNPPWATQVVSGVYNAYSGGVIRRIIFHDDNINTYAQCVMGCMLIALRAALSIHTVQVSIPAHPLIELDDQVAVLDQPSGTNSRMWVTKIEDEMGLGDQQTAFGSGGTGSWTMTLEGALLDTPEFQGVIADVLAIDWVALAQKTGNDPNQPPLPSPVITKTSRPKRTRGWPPT